MELDAAYRVSHLERFAVLFFCVKGRFYTFSLLIPDIVGGYIDGNWGIPKSENFLVVLSYNP